MHHNSADCSWFYHFAFLPTCTHLTVNTDDWLAFALFKLHSSRERSINTALESNWTRFVLLAPCLLNYQRHKLPLPNRWSRRWLMEWVIDAIQGAVPIVTLNLIKLWFPSECYDTCFRNLIAQRHATISLLPRRQSRDFQALSITRTWWLKSKKKQYEEVTNILKVQWFLHNQLLTAAMEHVRTINNFYIFSCWLERLMDMRGLLRWFSKKKH